MTKKFEGIKPPPTLVFSQSQRIESSGIKKFSNFNPYCSVNNSQQVIDSLTMVSAKRFGVFDFATMYTNLSLNVALENLKMVIKKSFFLSSKRFLKIDTYNKKAIWTNCFKITVSSRCYSLNMILDLLEFVLYHTYIRLVKLNSFTVL